MSNTKSTDNYIISNSQSIFNPNKTYYQSAYNEASALFDKFGQSEEELTNMILADVKNNIFNGKYKVFAINKKSGIEAGLTVKSLKETVLSIKQDKYFDLKNKLF